MPQTSIPERYYPRLLAWTFAGLIVLGGFSAITGFAFFPDIFWAQIGSIRWGASVGSGFGFLIGFLIARAVEQRVTAEREAIRAEAAEEKQELLEYLNALLRHEILNTANVISGHAGLVESTLDEDADSRENMEAIKRQTEELSSVINDVRLLLRASEEDPILERIDLRSMLEIEIGNIHDHYEEIETELDAPREIHVMAGRPLRQVFSNLLQNAVKHQDSEPKRVSISVTQAPDTVTVEIEDNGPGIPDDEREEIFDPEIKQRANHGIGLTTAARLTDRYGGNIELKETGPDGTVFTVTLPSPPSRSENRQKNLNR